VNKDVVENFRIIKKLIEHSYFEYKFYDVAALKSMVTLEMALKLRYEELSKTKWPKNKTLEKLIEWFEAGFHFEVYNPDYLDSMREIRNALAHPAAHGFSGPGSKHIIAQTVDLINGLYEDPLLRKERMNITIQFITRLESFKKGIKCSLNNSEYFAIRAWPAFVNNKFSPIEIHFYFNPCFQIPQSYLENSNWVVPPIIYFKANDIEFNEDSILLIKDKCSRLLIEQIKDQQEQKEFEDWMNKYKKYCHPVGDYIYEEEGLTDTFILHLREFHKL